MIRNLPPSPSRDRPTEFSGEMDVFLAALPGFVEDANALEQSLQVVATTGTSTTSLTVGLGSKSLTTAPGKAWATGAWVYIFAAAAVSNYMVGRVTSYNVETGALVVNVSAIDGSGMHSSWIIGLATPVADAHLVARDGSRSMSGELLLSGSAANALGAVPKQQMESADAATLAAANSAIAAAQAAIDAKLLGVSQTWQTVSRAGGTTYFNTTGRPIVLLVNAVTSGANVAGTVSISINGGGTFNFAAGGGATVGQTFVYGSVVIPIGASYVVNYNNIAGGVTTYELR